MLVKLIIPTIDTDNMSFDYNGRDFTKEEYDDMVLQQFNRNKDRINSYMQGERQYNPYGDVYDIEQEHDYYENETVDIEVDTIVLDSDGSDIDEYFFDNKLNSGKMFILTITPDFSYEGDDEDIITNIQNAESELKYWIEDSLLVWNDNRYDKKTKLQLSPAKTLKLRLDDNEVYVLNNCKVFEDYKNGFAILVEKITLE